MIASESYRDSPTTRWPNTYLRAKGVSEVVYPGPAPCVVPSDRDDDPVVDTAVVGKADVLCTLNRDFYNPLVLSYCRSTEYSWQ
jgi:hypothetical protein